MMKIFDIVLLYLLLFCFCGCGLAGGGVGFGGAGMVVVESDDGFEFFGSGDRVLFYQLRAKSLDGKFGRLNYIHPLYNLDGEVITEDFPADHLHQRGVFWAWHQLYVGDKRLGDGWSLEGFAQEVVSAKILEIKADSAAVRTEVLWKSPLWVDGNGAEKPFVKVTTVVRVYKAEGDGRKIDFTISLLALEKDVRVGGSENARGYGGFSARIKLKDDYVFTGRGGVVKPKNEQVEVGGWVDVSGRYGASEKVSGLAILCHKNNAGYPTAWILRRKGSMQNAVYPGREAVRISETEPTVLRYRLVLHRGGGGSVDINRLEAEYSGQAGGK